MAKRKIVWSNKAKIKLFEILKFYTTRNKSSSYSKKLNKKIHQQTKLLLKQPEIGLKTEMDAVRGLIVDEYLIFYEIFEDTVAIHTIWDCRQDPLELNVK